MEDTLLHPEVNSNLRTPGKATVERVDAFPCDLKM